MNHLKLQQKNWLLVKKYVLILTIIAAGIPLYTFHAIGLISPVLIPLLCQMSFAVYISHNQLEMVEYKYKGNILLCTTAYSRKELVLSKYLFIFLVEMFCVIVYLMLSFVFRKFLAPLNIGDLIVVFFFMTVIYGLYIPAMMKFGYEKTRFIPALLTIAIPYLSSWIIYRTSLLSSGFAFGIQIALFVVAFAILYTSILVATNIYKKIDL
ncbi:hypothetical protein M2454_000644 [Aequitasia blattaphilus]|uniref:ABC-2 transporter permease n=1 Tax=Aequitasia blattaphilus TaxID=2949332 RepID=A0ABT1E8I1_9FIRM|nr:ABC-2 transporter permease [Aequitasia blattaphilus]MCP1102136.1 ABC-2 transporter permease [Aequitasia blattaphilus]MCR8614776.1 ABC-2 transporter permease [Aequitasia blattaphilus]